MTDDTRDQAPEHPAEPAADRPGRRYLRSHPTRPAGVINTVSLAALMVVILMSRPQVLQLAPIPEPAFWVAFAVVALAAAHCAAANLRGRRSAVPAVVAVTLGCAVSVVALALYG
uniref:hypothetical protein n=1 Tax=Microbispora cellulosiformans TaxID=2614688 RepID=UPI00178659C3|nr:hypothetical protein [Microbispora cellulosiformans]